MDRKCIQNKNKNGYEQGTSMPDETGTSENQKLSTLFNRRAGTINKKSACDRTVNGITPVHRLYANQ